LPTATASTIARDFGGTVLMKNNERFNTQESDAMYRLAMLIQLATDLFGSV